MDWGRIVLQDQLSSLRAPTGLVAVTTPSSDQVVSLLNGRVVSVSDGVVLVRHDDPAELNALLVSKDIPVSALGPSLRTLEDVVLEATSSSSDRVDSS